MSYQKVIVVGNLGREPELKALPNGNPVTSFSLAVTRKWRSLDGAPAEETTWFRVSAYNRQAEIAKEFLHKGNQAMVEGRLSPDKTGNPRVWTAQDGTPRSSFELVADRIILLNNPATDIVSPSASPSPASSSTDEMPPAMDDIPF